jgi:deferrochelatase/peroxidase EfeB
VGEFHTFLKATAEDLGVSDPGNASAARLVGARLVGRWPSGAPVVREPDQENQAMADNDCANNDFEFGGPSKPIANAPGPGQCQRTTPVSPGDPPGLRCPFTGHIRKAYPRDDEAIRKTGAPDPFDARQRLNEKDTQTHRLLRRGIPFGPVSRSTPESPFIDDVDRGLHFLAYQTSIVDQFEFVTRAWVNNPVFKEPFDPSEPDPTKRGGHDPIIGQNPDGPREFTVTFPDPAAPGGVRAVRVTTEADWVIPSGGGYFFAPSIDALETKLT